TLEKKPLLWSIPGGLISGLVKIGDVLPLPLNSERLKKLTESYVVSNTKIKSALGITELPLSAKQGLERPIRSCKDPGGSNYREIIGAVNTGSKVVVSSTKHTIYLPYNLSKSSPCFKPSAFSMRSSSKASGEPLPKYKNSGCGEIVT